MPRLYTRPSVHSGESVADDAIGDGGYGVLATVAGESCSLLVASGVLAASVIIWEACAFAALAAALVAGVTWCLSLSVAGSGSQAAGPAAFPTAATAGRASRVCGLAAIDISALPKSPYQHRLAGGRGGPAAGGDVVTCVVCLEDLRGGEMVRSLPECRHVYHVGCIDAWLQMHVTCPLCRFDLSPRRPPVTPAAAVGSQSQTGLLSSQ